MTENNDKDRKIALTFDKEMHPEKYQEQEQQEEVKKIEDVEDKNYC